MARISWFFVIALLGVAGCGTEGSTEADYASTANELTFVRAGAACDDATVVCLWPLECIKPPFAPLTVFGVCLDRAKGGPCSSDSDCQQGQYCQFSFAGGRGFCC